MKLRLYLNIFLLISLIGCSSDDSSPAPKTDLETTYFPPIDGTEWKTKSVVDMGWNESELTPLLNFLEEENTKGFIILHNGKIVIEEYMNGHTSNSAWYWASAGKTLTTAISGIAQEEGLIDINNKVSDYLGTGWTSAPLEKENLITCKHLLSMNSGLDDSIGDSVSPINLQYMADAGTRWAYHNVFLKMQDVIAEASNNSWNAYFNAKLKDKIGMTGAWLQTGDFNFYWSNTRSMARYGLMMLENGIWNESQIIPENFLNEATNTSQDINTAYGYLWWINGKSNYYLPYNQIEFNGKLVYNAPNDMYAAMGKDDQRIYIIPSKNLVITRMGNAAEGTGILLTSFDIELWKRINALVN